MKNLTESSNRQYYLDWIRVLAMAVIFFHHNARLFNAGEDWHVKNASSNLAASIAVIFNGQWLMPLFFLIAGAGVYYALQSRRAGQFALERTLRLLVPLIFGMLVIVVPQAYFEAVSHGEQLGQYNIFQIYAVYLQTLPNMNWFHLWFMVDLFLFSIITIPLFFVKIGGQTLISRLARSFDNPWALLSLFVISITLVNVLVYPDGFWGYRNGGWNIITYLLFFIFGYLIFAHRRFKDMLTRIRWISLVAGILTFAFIILYVSLFGDPQFGAPMYVFGMLVQALGTWGWLLAILGFGSRYLNRNNRVLAYANEAVLPFYILHQTVIIVIGFFVVQWDTGVGLKYLVISTTSLIGIMAIYELLVRRLNILRWLSGMKPVKRAQPVQISDSEKLVQTR
jgi:glucans biosynthesis protein C